MTSRSRLLAALLALTGCGGSSSSVGPPVATTIQLSTNTVSFSSLLATHDVVATVLSETGTPMPAIIAWDTSNGDVASVTQLGRITATGNGSAEITASASGLQAKVTVNVQQVPFTVLLEPDPVELIGPLDTETVLATVRDAGGSEVVPPASITWASQNELVATVDESGVVTGVATGQTTVTAAVATGGAPLEESVTVNVGGDVLVVTTSLPEGQTGVAYEASLVAVGGDGDYAWSLASGSLPDGLDLAADGTISGTPTADGIFSFTVEVASDGKTDQQALEIEVMGTVILSTSYLIGGNVGVTYGDQIASAQGSGPFTYSVTGGDLPDGLSINAANGTISGTPTASGVFFFEVTASNGADDSAATYAITISTVPANAFNLWITYYGGALPPANVVIGLSEAVARWEEVVIGDVVDVTFPPTGLDPGETCLLFDDPGMLNGAFVEDVVVLMGIQPFDGPTQTLARGGPCGYFNENPPVTISGQMSLDEADVLAADADYMEQIIWHEIGHVMGIGTLWQDSLSGVGTPDPRYDGTNGNTEWRALGTAFDGVPVQPNTEGHWDEAWLDEEIMTPMSEGPLGEAPISRVTIGTLTDLGWTTDLTAADPFTLPGCAESCTLQAPDRDVPIDIVVIEPLIPLPPPK